MILLLLAAQVATPAAAPAPEQTARINILVPIPDEPCVRRGKAADNESRPDDIVVCGQPLPSQKLPYPNEVVLDEPKPSNPDMTGTGALAAEHTPCGARSGGCQTGMDLFGGGTAAVRLVQKLVAPSSCCEDPGEGTNPGKLISDAAKGIGHAFRKKPDKSNRVPIPLDDTPPRM